jgi:cell division septation protein DedD
VSEPADFEIVLGRGQVASTMLLVLVVLVVFGGGGYVIGKSASPKVAVVQAAAPAAVVPAMTAPSPEIANAAALITKAPVVPSPAVSKPLSADLSAPLYAEQATGKVYLQVGAVDKGLATIWAEGLRTHALSAFVAPGPNDKVWRVVIGPLPTPESFTQAKTTLDQLGINTFGRKQQ